jgi:hypothetical protein
MNLLILFEKIYKDTRTPMDMSSPSGRDEVPKARRIDTASIPIDLALRVRAIHVARVKNKPWKR